MLGYVSDRAGNKKAFLSSQRTQVNFHWKLVSIFMKAIEFQALAHWTHTWRSGKTVSTTRVKLAKALGHEHFNASAQQLLASIAKQVFELSVDENDMTDGIDDHEPVGSCLDNPTVFVSLLHQFCPT